MKYKNSIGQVHDLVPGANICDMHDKVAQQLDWDEILIGLYKEQRAWTFNLCGGSALIEANVNQHRKTFAYHYTNKLLTFIGETQHGKLLFAYSYDDKYLTFIEITLVF